MKGKRYAYTKDKILNTLAEIVKREDTITNIAKKHGVSRQSVYYWAKHIKGLKTTYRDSGFWEDVRERLVPVIENENKKIKINGTYTREELQKIMEEMK